MFSVISDNATIRKCNVKPNETGNPPSLKLIKILGISHLRDGVDLQSGSAITWIIVSCQV